MMRRSGGRIKETAEKKERPEYSGLSEKFTFKRSVDLYYRALMRKFSINNAVTMYISGCTSFACPFTTLAST